MWTEKTNHEGYDDPTAYEALRNIECEEAVNRYQRLVFICSPFAGNVSHNIRMAREFSRFALEQNVIPVAPHLLYPQLLNDNDPAQRITGLACGLALLRRCHELWVFGGHASSGMRLELALARRRGLAVRFFSADCKEVPPFA